jgi:exosome complex RNA-binding protein Rrp42 (RNase PH superfamily)
LKEFLSLRARTTRSKFDIVNINRKKTTLSDNYAHASFESFFHKSIRLLDTTDVLHLNRLNIRISKLLWIVMVGIMVFMLTQGFGENNTMSVIMLTVMVVLMMFWMKKKKTIPNLMHARN